jgi:polyhydroxyalkanoate synthase
MLDTVAPSNFPATNPEVLTRTISSGGINLLRGWQNFLEDWERALNGKKPIGAEHFVVGRDVAKTPGEVVFRDRLLELIQYAPATAQVRPEPVLIVPAWIMKYYILDLSPHNSLVKYLTDQGFTVFMVSWKNPGPDDREIGMEDYRASVMSAFDAVGAILPDRKVHAVGYCLGGALLSIAAAAMSRDRDDRIATLTLFAAQTDFTEAGELMMLTDESQIAFLEDLMWEQGFLDGKQMAGMFQMLRSNDLVWSRVIRDYMLGDRPAMTDLMAWNSDATRMPYRMHSQYLRGLFLNNDLAEGRYLAAGKPVALSDLRAPVFCGRHRARSRRALAFDLQDNFPNARRRDLRAHYGRPQCGHCVAARARRPRFPHRGERRRPAVSRSRSVFAGGETRGRLVVAAMDILAGGAFRRTCRTAANGHFGGRLRANRRCARSLRLDGISAAGGVLGQLTYQA